MRSLRQQQRSNKRMFPRDRSSFEILYIVALLFARITVTDGHYGEIYRDPLIKIGYHRYTPRHIAFF